MKCIKDISNGIIISAICIDIESISGIPYVAIWYVDSYFVIAALNLDLNGSKIGFDKYNVRIYYIKK